MALYFTITARIHIYPLNYSTVYSVQYMQYYTVNISTIEQLQVFGPYTSGV